MILFCPSCTGAWIIKKVNFFIVFELYLHCYMVAFVVRLRTVLWHLEFIFYSKWPTHTQTLFTDSESESDVTCGQVWWPILRICALHLSHPKCTHTEVNTHTPWTHTRSSGQPFMLRHPGSSWGFGDLLKGTSVMVLRVKRALDIHSPHLQSPPDLRLEPATFVFTSPTL